MTLCHIDVESFSRADIRKVGAHQYARDPSTELLMVAWRVEDETLGEFAGFHDFTADDVPPFDLLGLFRDPDVTFAAFNANFEMAIFEHCLGVAFAPERWVCVQALALSYGFPASLAGVGDAMGLVGDAAKDKDGKKLIQKFSVPQPRDGRRVMPDEDPDAWARFCNYCRRDVVAESEIFRRLAA